MHISIRKALYTAAVLLTALTAMILCGLYTSAAEPVLAYAADGFADPRADIFAPQNSSATRIFDISISDWDVIGDRQRKRHRDVDGRICLMSELPDPEKTDSEFAGYTSFVITLDEYAGAHNTLMFGIIAEGEGDIPIPVRVEVSTVNESVTAEINITPGQWNLITMDARTLESRITEMRVTANYGSQIPDSVSMTKPYLTRTLPAGLTYAENYAANRWTAIEGRALIKNGWISVNENGRALITAPLVSVMKQTPGSTVYFEISIDNAVSGTMTLGVLYDGASEEQREYQKKISLNASDGVYTVPVKADAAIVSYALRFENMVCENSGFTIRSVRLYSEGTTAVTVSGDLGRVESITRKGASIVFSGSMERETAAEYSDSAIHFYAIPGWYANNLDHAVDLGSVSMTTRFQYTANLAAMGASAAADTFRFFAGIPLEDEILPISQPRCPDASPYSADNVSNMGMYGGASVGVFESNASHVMVEIPLDRLILSASGLKIPYTLINSAPGAGTFSMNGTRSLTLDEDMLRELDREIDFYLSAGIRVYLRLTAASPVPGLTYGGNSSENYAVRATDSEARQMYAALIRTLSSRWNGISGIALGRAVNYSGLVGDSAMDNPAMYAADLAEICRITYNAAAVYVPDIAVIVPYVEHMENYNGLWLADRTIAVMLADKLEEIGAMPWILMYSVDSAEDDLTSPVTLSRMLTDLELDSPSGLMIFWQPDSQKLLKEYLIHSAENNADMSQYIANLFGKLCQKCTSFRARAVFLSMADLPDGAGYEFYKYLKSESAGDSGRLVYGTEAINTRKLTDHDAVLGLWDFSESHHTMGWLAGSGVSSCVTDYSPLLSAVKAGTEGTKQTYTRALRATVDLSSGASTGASGIVLCQFDETLSFRGIEGMDFTIALSRSDGSDIPMTATLIFVIGTEDTRAEFTAENISCGQVRSFHCDLTGYSHPDTIDYVGVIVYADQGVTLDIGEVNVHTTQLSETELSSLINGSQNVRQDMSNEYRLALILCAVTVVMSVAAVIAITRHESEEEQNIQNTGGKS